MSQHPVSILHVDTNTKSPLIPAAKVWFIAAKTARAGIQRGILSKSALFRATAHAAHCCRGNLALMDAHAIALDAVREALREVQA